MARTLIAGESWTTTSIHTKGFDSFTTVAYEEGVKDFAAALESAGHDVTFMPNHVAAAHFPSASDELDGYDVVVLSDIGSNTLLMPNDVFLRGKPHPNRLLVLRDWVRAGGALMMVGGYLSFQGIEAKANYRNSALAEALPVLMEDGDDREECPEGAVPRLFGPEHPCTAGLPDTWPALLGFQRLSARSASQVLAQVNGHPLLTVGRYGRGRSVAFASDIGPHWAPTEFTQWDGFARLWSQTVSWLAAKDTP
ncbi:glutamine amidotransferase [Mycolicibacterium baixiangningiae]|uniref:glutamine amidotransferase n=1 Tax=Mycolicibacterium baixiangningiae TaxID=2761578 RepID=UPI0018670EF9|nr:glutamine amidotransferase [Mycolicibacterium baixiangningiae]